MHTKLYRRGWDARLPATVNSWQAQTAEGTSQVCHQGRPLPVPIQAAVHCHVHSAASPARPAPMYKLYAWAPGRTHGHRTKPRLAQLPCKGAPWPCKATQCALKPVQDRYDYLWPCAPAVQEYSALAASMRPYAACSLAVGVFLALCAWAQPYARQHSTCSPKTSVAGLVHEGGQDGAGNAS